MKPAAAFSVLRKFFPLSVLVVVFSLIPPQALAEFSTGVMIGSMGAGVVVTQPVTERIALQAFWQGASINREIESDTLTYQGDLKLSQLGFSSQWRPFAKNFFVSIGLVRSQNKVLLNTDEAGAFILGNDNYIGNVSIAGTANFAPVSPIIRIGWDTLRLNQKGLGYFVELGLLWQDTPEVELSATGTATKSNSTLVLNAVNHPQFQKSLENEQSSLEEELDALQLFPVLNVGIRYTF